MSAKIEAELNIVKIGVYNRISLFIYLTHLTKKMISSSVVIILIFFAHYFIFYNNSLAMQGNSASISIYESHNIDFEKSCYRYLSEILTYQIVFNSKVGISAVKIFDFRKKLRVYSDIEVEIRCYKYLGIYKVDFSIGYYENHNFNKIMTKKLISIFPDNELELVNSSRLFADSIAIFIEKKLKKFCCDNIYYYSER